MSTSPARKVKRECQRYLAKTGLHIGPVKTLDDQQYCVHCGFSWPIRSS